MSTKFLGAVSMAAAIAATAQASATSAVELCNNGNIYGVLNRPAKAFTVCHFAKPVHLSKIMTYHWNNGRGAPSGTISVQNNSTGAKYGPFRVAPSSGQGGAPNVYWNAQVDLRLPAGDYKIFDSDVATWSWNPQSQNNGIVVITGEFEAPLRTTAPTSPPPKPDHHRPKNRIKLHGLFHS